MGPSQELSSADSTTSDGGGKGLFSGYTTVPGGYDEAFARSGELRAGVRRVLSRLDEIGAGEFLRRRARADDAFLRHGVTFTLYSEGDDGQERIFPFDLIPRIVSARDWVEMERGLQQRIRALQHFLDDVYGDERILKEGVVPRDLVLGSKGYLTEVRGIRPPRGVRIHIAGIDVIRDGEGRFRVLEDNLRVPSGVSYVLENRIMMKRVYPVIFSTANVFAVDVYPARLRAGLGESSPGDRDHPRIVVLTPGPFNSAYFEHSFLARRMGCELVHGSDLFVENDTVYLRATNGSERVDVIYRRIDDLFLDPEVFLEDSLLGVPGLMRAYAAGNVALANAPGNGVADDKAIYPFVPDMVRFYLGEDPILAQVETFLCARDDHRRHVLANLDSMVVKAVDAAGGYGMLMGPSATSEEREEFRGRIQANPRGYIAQPRIELSTAPTWIDGSVAPRRLDFRPYIVSGEDVWVLPGGLTRVALKEGSYVVNSSQGGGSKDTWVLAGE
jgi:uncharacterized circularly permuted ATP-grasp superfamily protein